ANELSSCPELAVQACLAVAEPSVAEDFGIEAAHLEQYVATNRHVDPEEDSVEAQLKAAAEVHQAQAREHSRIGLHQAAQPRWRCRLPVGQYPTPSSSHSRVLGKASLIGREPVGRERGVVVGENQHVAGCCPRTSMPRVVEAQLWL